MDEEEEEEEAVCRGGGLLLVLEVVACTVDVVELEVEVVKPTALSTALVTPFTTLPTPPRMPPRLPLSPLPADAVCEDDDCVGLLSPTASSALSGVADGDADDPALQRYLRNH